MTAFNPMNPEAGPDTAKSAAAIHPAAWAGFFAGWLLFYSASSYLLEFFSVFVAVATSMVGVTALAITGTALARKRTQLSVLCVVAVLATWCVWVYAPVRDLGLAIRFGLEQAQYAAAIADLTSGREPACAAAKACQYDAGPPRRLAFSWGGVIDNWAGIIYDPTGDIQDVQRNRGVFGGDLVGCRLVREHFYLCSFT